MLAKYKLAVVFLVIVFLIGFNCCTEPAMDNSDMGNRGLNKEKVSSLSERISKYKLSHQQVMEGQKKIIKKFENLKSNFKSLETPKNYKHNAETVFNQIPKKTIKPTINSIDKPKDNIINKVKNKYNQ